MDIEDAFREYRDSMLRSMVYFSGDDEAAEDGVSHAFTQALVHRAMLENMPEPAAKAWLFAAARNAIMDIKRRETRFRYVGNPEESFDIPDPRQDDPAGRATVELLLAKLPESLRIPVELKYYEGLESPEIGDLLKIPSATVRTRLRTALRQIKDHGGFK